MRRFFTHRYTLVYLVVYGLMGMVPIDGCSVNTGVVLHGGKGGATDLAKEAESDFGRRPRTPELVSQAYEGMAKAAQRSAADDPLRYSYLVRAARMGLWLAHHDEDHEFQTEDVILFCNTAIAIDSSRVEGFYYRAVAMGLIAKANKLKGRSAMNTMRSDLQAALVRNPDFDHGGPHRILGALYLRAPGPPTGIGSTRRALHHLLHAHQIDPKYPDNILFLAEAYQKLKRFDQVKALLIPFIDDGPSTGDEPAKQAWLDRARKMLRSLKPTG